MARFERKIRKRLKGETEDFDVWFEKNKEHFPGFVNEESEEEEPQGTVKLKKKKFWIIPTAFVLVALCVFLCFLPMILNNKENSLPLYFGDEAVYGLDLTEQEQEDIKSEYPFISKLTLATYRKLLRTEDESLVFMIIRGEIETENDYYFVTMQVEFNPYYNFLDKANYENLEAVIELDDNLIHYESQGLDSDELYWYYMLTESNGQRIYWEVHCFEESIEEFIQIIFSE